MKCFYHADADGKCAGFWVHKLVEHSDFCWPENDWVSMDYGKEFPFDIICQDEKVYLVDYSIEPNEMKRLLNMTKNVTWIDHHKTAIDKYKDFDEEIRGIRFDGVSGCMLTYCYLTHMTDNGDGPIFPFTKDMMNDAPTFTAYIDDYDVWRFKYGENTKLFQLAFNAYDFAPWSEEWIKFFDDNTRTHIMVEEGAAMEKYRDGWAKSVMEVGFETEFEGHNCYAVNLPRCNSQYFDSLQKGKYAIFMPFYWNGEIWSISLYSETVDVSEIAKKYAGGGHKGASGFQTKQLPFKKEE